MSQPLIAVDVGNSRIKFGLFDSAVADAGCLPQCRCSLAVAIDDDIPWDEIVRWSPEAARMASVVAGSNPQGVQKVRESWRERHWPEPSIVDDPGRFPLEVRLAEPRKAGVDRLLNAVAANVIRPAGRPTVIVDSGTATTVDCVGPEGAFYGGAILPGFEMSARALNHYTSLLPFVSIDELADESHEPLGTDTREALRSGLFWGQLGAVRELVAQLAAAHHEPVFLLLTGGGASLLATHLENARCEPHLALQGLAIVADRLFDSASESSSDG